VKHLQDHGKPLNLWYCPTIQRAGKEAAVVQALKHHPSFFKCKAALIGDAATDTTSSCQSGGRVQMTTRELTVYRSMQPYGTSLDERELPEQSCVRLVMDYVPCISLLDAVRATKGLPEAAVCSIIRQLVVALDHLHGVGYAHMVSCMDWCMHIM
jgi:serine/threonine protein kinase